MKQILIAGAGDFGREMFGWLTTDPRHGVEWEVGGFLDDNPQALNAYLHYPTRIIGSIKDHQPQPHQLLVLALATSQTRLKIGEMMTARGAEFLTWIHPSATINRFCTIGRGCVICPQAVVSADARIGDFVSINCTSNIGHDCVIGDGCTINAHCDLTGHTKFGRGVYIGSNVCVVPRIRVGDFAQLGAGSVVVRNVKAETTVMGPAAQRLTFDTPAAA